MEGIVRGCSDPDCGKRKFCLGSLGLQVSGNDLGSKGTVLQSWGTVGIAPAEKGLERKENT